MLLHQLQLLVDFAVKKITRTILDGVLVIRSCFLDLYFETEYNELSDLVRSVVSRTPDPIHFSSSFILRASFSAVVNTGTISFLAAGSPKLGETNPADPIPAQPGQ